MIFKREKCKFANCNLKISSKSGCCAAGHREQLLKICPRCKNSVKEETKSCPCGNYTFQHNLETPYSDRWRRRPNELMATLLLLSPEMTGISRGAIRIEAGTEAILIKDGEYNAKLTAGYHESSTFLQRLTGSYKQKVEALIYGTHPTDLNYTFAKDSFSTQDNCHMGLKLRCLVLIKDPKMVKEKMGTSVDSDGVLTCQNVVNVTQSFIQEILNKHFPKAPVKDLLNSSKMLKHLENFEKNIFPEIEALLELTGLHLDEVFIQQYDCDKIQKLRDEKANHALDIEKWMLVRQIEKFKADREVSLTYTEAEKKEKLDKIAQDFKIKELHLNAEWENLTSKLKHEQETLSLHQKGEIFEIASTQELLKLKHKQEKVKIEEETENIKHQQQLNRKQKTAQTWLDTFGSKSGKKIIEAISQNENIEINALQIHKDTLKRCLKPNFAAQSGNLENLYKLCQMVIKVRFPSIHFIDCRSTYDLIIKNYSQNPISLKIALTGRGLCSNSQKNQSFHLSPFEEKKIESEVDFTHKGNCLLKFELKIETTLGQDFIFKKQSQISVKEYDSKSNINADIVFNTNSSISNLDKTDLIAMDYRLCEWQEIAFELVKQNISSFNNCLKMKMVPMREGDFTLGFQQGDLNLNHDPDNNPIPSHEEPVEAKISKHFWIARYPVLISQWKQLIPKQVYSGIYLPKNISENAKEDRIARNGKSNSTANLSWLDLMAFCKILTILERKKGTIPPGYEYRLATEAEWEYACRFEGCLTDEYYKKNEQSLVYKNQNYPTDITQFQDNQPKNAPHEGLVGMIGNVWEWVIDSFDAYNPLPHRGGIDPIELNGLKNESSISCVRGGSWDKGRDQENRYHTCYARGWASINTRSSVFGGRIVLAPIIKLPKKIDSIIEQHLKKS